MGSGGGDSGHDDRTGEGFRTAGQRVEVHIAGDVSEGSTPTR